MNQVFISYSLLDEPAIDISRGLYKKYDNSTEMFKATEDFFLSIGWPALPPNFWKNSVLQAPKDGKVVTCHPTAWDMYGTENGRKDLRFVILFFFTIYLNK